MCDHGPPGSACASTTASRGLTTAPQVFGYIVIVIAGLMAVLGVIGGLATVSRAPAAALGAIVTSLIIAAVLFLQGALVLMLSYYVQMRSEEVSMRVTRMLEDDGDDAD